jgi:hypothetical protein
LEGISQAELRSILDRDALFRTPCTLPLEGLMYDIVTPVVSSGIF